jgi:hypothetical protein
MCQLMCAQGPGKVPVDGFDMWPYLMDPTNSSSPHPWLLLGMANGTNGDPHVLLLMYICLIEHRGTHST